MSAETSPEPPALWAEIPDGYVALPLTDIPATMATAERLIDELGTAQQRDLAPGVLASLGAHLSRLAGDNAVYCGLGAHATDDIGVVTSSLVISLLGFPGARNPRLLLKELLLAKQRAGERGEVELGELPGGPVLFFERTRMLPVPVQPRDHVLAEPVEAPVWQTEVLVPNSEGDRLATIEFSTPDVAAGPRYRRMLAELAATLRFEPPVTSDPLAALLG
jgi:hypothetical protein